MVRLEPELANVKCSCTENPPIKTSTQNDQDYQAYPAWGEVKVSKVQRHPGYSVHSYNLPGGRGTQNDMAQPGHTGKVALAIIKEFCWRSLAL